VSWAGYFPGHVNVSHPSSGTALVVSSATGKINVNSNDGKYHAFIAANGTAGLYGSYEPIGPWGTSVGPTTPGSSPARLESTVTSRPRARNHL